MAKHELIDLLDETGKTVGVIDKAVAHEKGLWHRSVHLWIINDKNQILVQKRSSKKEFFPNVYDVSVAGHIGAGEHSLNTAVREAEEEIGLTVDEKKVKFLFTIKEELTNNNIISREFVDVYLLKENLDEKSLTYQKEEVAYAKFMPLSEFYASLNKKEFLPHTKEYELLKPYLFEPNLER